MKRLMVILCILLMLGNISSCEKPVGSQYYDGEVLLPDYVHSDTLVVTNAWLLNWYMKRVDGSDGEIMEALELTTRVY